MRKAHTGAGGDVEAVFGLFFRRKLRVGHVEDCLRSWFLTSKCLLRSEGGSCLLFVVCRMSHAEFQKLTFAPASRSALLREQLA
jgi:hypothetical protein